VGEDRSRPDLQHPTVLAAQRAEILAGYVKGAEKKG